MDDDNSDEYSDEENIEAEGYESDEEKPIEWTVEGLRDYFDNLVESIDLDLDIREQIEKALSLLPNPLSNTDQTNDG